MNDRILARLSRGPADELSLARWCDLPQARHVRPLLERMCRARCIRETGGRYALPVNPLSPAGRIVIGRGYRWRMS